MIRGRLKCAQFALTLIVFLMPLFSFALAAYFRFATNLLPRISTDADPASYFALLLFTTCLWAIFTEHYGVTSLENRLAATNKTRGILFASLMTYAIVLSAVFFYRATTFSRVFIWLSGPILPTLTFAADAAFRYLWNPHHSSEKAAARVLIVGTDRFALRVAQSLDSDRLSPCHVSAYLKLPGQASVVENVPIYDISDVRKLAIGGDFTDVVIAIPPHLLAELPQIRAQLAPVCVPTRLVLDFGESLLHPRLFTLGDLLLLDLQESPAESILYVILKRAFDLAFSSGVLLLTFPLLVLIAVAVRLSSPGPVIFVQDRVGLNGKLFPMYKFRTMTVSHCAESDSRWTVKGDPRCTPIGRILRRTGLDELPQFFNVLKGDMSVVGPRPERPVLVQKFMHSVGNYNSRHYLKVGITGWAQVNGWRGDTSIEKRVEYDLYYVRNWTLSFDFLIVLLTLVRGFTDKNAY
jgi:Undecaprenyl-phosphate glucose phosphotransferase